MNNHSHTSTTRLATNTWLMTAIALIALVALTVALSNRHVPGAGTSVVTSDPTYAKVKSTRLVRAGYIVYPPTVNASADVSHPTGFLIDIMNEIAGQAGFNVQYEPTSFDDFAAGLQSGKFDVVVAGIFENIPRAREMTFVRPIVYWAGVTAIAKTDKAKDFTSLSSLNQPAVRIAVTAGTAEHDFVKKNLPKASVTARPDNDISLTLAEVTAGRADVAFADAVTVRKFLRGRTDVSILFDGRQFNTFPTSFVVRPADLEWLQFLNTAVESLQTDGTIRRLSDKYNGDQVWTLPALPFEQHQ